MSSSATTTTWAGAPASTSSRRSSPAARDLLDLGKGPHPVDDRDARVRSGKAAEHGAEIGDRRIEVADAVRLHGNYRPRGKRRYQRPHVLPPVPAPAQDLLGVGVDHF